MGNLDTYLDALRFLAQSSEPEATKLMTAELRIREFLSAVAPTPAAQRAALEELDAVIGEVEITQYAVSFWHRNQLARSSPGASRPETICRT
jgi:hypothetical protein